MSKLIIAGIINLNTGELSHTTSNPKDKLAIRTTILKELNKDSENYLHFEFGKSISSLPYIQRKMKNKEPELLEELILHSRRFILKGLQQSLLETKEDIKNHQEILKESKETYADNRKKFDIVEHLIEEAMIELNQDKESLEFTISQQKINIKKLEKKLNMESTMEP